MTPFTVHLFSGRLVWFPIGWVEMSCEAGSPSIMCGRQRTKIQKVTGVSASVWGVASSLPVWISLLLASQVFWCPCSACSLLGTKLLRCWIPFWPKHGALTLLTWAMELWSITLWMNWAKVLYFPFLPTASVSEWLLDSPMPTLRWCFQRWKSWWSSWSCYPRTPTTIICCSRS